MNEGSTKSNDLKRIRGKYDFKERNGVLDYRTNEVYDGALNYKQFIKIHNRFIQNDLKLIGGDGCYLLFYLIAYSHNREYMKTTIGQIQDNMRVSKDKINKALKLLHKHEMISIKGMKSFTKDIGVNDILSIVIIYGNEMYDITLNDTIGIGYKAVPIDYIKHCIVMLEPMEFSILLCLILRFRYYLPLKPKIGEKAYTYQILEYAFPKLDTIGDYFGSTRKTIKKYIMKLAEKEFITYEPNGKEFIKKYNEKDDKYESVNPNYKYRVNLLQRIEYLYYNYYILPDTYDNANKQADRDNILKRIKSKGFEAVAQSSANMYVLEKDYINYAYGIDLGDFKKLIERQDFDTYNKMTKRMIPNFTNEEVLEPIKRKIPKVEKVAFAEQILLL